MDWKVALGGWVVGLLIGLTGMGGGSVMTPMMIFLFHMHPALAVGTDLVYSCVTKLAGTIQHIRQKTVDFRILGWMSLGSIPGALMGSLVVRHLEHQVAMDAADRVIGQMLGGMYILIVLAMAWRWWQKGRGTASVFPGRVPRVALSVLGLAAGFLVGLTSVGSGALLVSVLAMISSLSAARLVGTDIAAGVLVTGVAGLAHLAFGNVDLRMVVSLLVGSVPGILMGSRFIVRVPEPVVRVGLMTLLSWSSYNLLK
ncbi:MAG: sulfite exporter TauE/SafE family protein [Alicyclobacillus macrosporangiidus]|uniref:sulfite exporter TauE/SafE family protein n=1 Tax=Alicyclobacillus macrosporangiidus TaxID=392015 RepID=UPI0026EC4696|nr:sulfite exporter TauE/SafE family protein [Alicyclobacillus macrosporangiidus]MCL6600759.1 sulfite exporter TauE/SafE family protein [Alicyclobacillus macrosporangiidus]